MVDRRCNLRGRGVVLCCGSGLSGVRDDEPLRRGRRGSGERVSRGLRQRVSSAAGYDRPLSAGRFALGAAFVVSRSGSFCCVGLARCGGSVSVAAASLASDSRIAPTPHPRTYPPVPCQSTASSPRPRPASVRHVIAKLTMDASSASSAASRRAGVVVLRDEPVPLAAKPDASKTSTTPPRRRECDRQNRRVRTDRSRPKDQLPRTPGGRENPLGRTGGRPDRAASGEVWRLERVAGTTSRGRFFATGRSRALGRDRCEVAGQICARLHPETAAGRRRHAGCR